MTSRSDADPQAFYRPELDGLRFFAFLAVYVEHTIGFGSGGSHHHLPAWLGDFLGAVGVAGNFGVDLFFVLSAYLITELLLREISCTGSLDVRAFYVRRMLRIWPLYFFVLALAYGLVFFPVGEGLTWWHLAGFVFFAGNWVYFLHPVVTVAGPLWSVSLEEQFYIVWPWTIRRLGVGRLYLIALAILVFAMMFRWGFNLLNPAEDWVSKNSFCRLDGIAVGVLLALRLRGGVPVLSGLQRAGMLGAALGALLFIARFLDLFSRPIPSVALMLGWLLAALACGAVLLSVLGAQGLPGRLLRSAPLIYLGRRSFGLYAYHELFLKLGGQVFPAHDSSAGQMLCYWFFGLGLTLMVAVASYRWLESPFLRIKRRRFTHVQSRPD